MRWWPGLGNACIGTLNKGRQGCKGDCSGGRIPRLCSVDTFTSEYSVCPAHWRGPTQDDIPSTIFPIPSVNNYNKVKMQHLALQLMMISRHACMMRFLTDSPRPSVSVASTLLLSPPSHFDIPSHPHGSRLILSNPCNSADTLSISRSLTTVMGVSVCIEVVCSANAMLLAKF